MKPSGAEGRTLRNVAIFSVAALSCGWLGRLVDLKVESDAGGSLGQLIWIVVPLLTMAILRTWAGDGWKDFGVRPRMKGNDFPYAVSLLFFPVLAALVAGAGALLGWADVSGPASSLIAGVSAALLPQFVKNLFEEFAWRGYMAPKLLGLGYPRLAVHVAVGLVWGAWHIPYLHLFFDTGESMATFIPRMMIGVVAMAVLYGEIRLATGSVWPAVLMHTVGNAVVNTLVLDRYFVAREGYGWIAAPSPEGLLSIALTGLAGLWMYKRVGAKRRKSNRSIGELKG